MNIRDIANLAGVSASTVSKVMNGKDKDISEETRKKVLEVIEREHYVPYFKFLDKAGMKNRLVGLILQKNNQEKERYIAVAERIARENNYGLVIGYSEDENDTKILCQDMILKKVSGILTEYFVNIADKREKGVIVNYNDTSGLNELNETIFYYKISEAVELAVENFVQEGHQKIACIVNKSQIGLLKDYKLAMQNKNMQINPAWMYIYEEIEEFGISQFIGESETAIICGTPEIACRVAGILEKRKTNIPEELSIIAIGEGKELQYVSGGITAIDFPIEEEKCKVEKEKIIIDCDPGSDDALVIILALYSGKLDLKAVCSVTGNGALDTTTRNGLNILSLCGREDIPLYRGSAVALDQKQPETVSAFGDDGLGGFAHTIASDKKEEDQNAVDFLVEYVNGHPKEITLFAIGPCTNIAHAIRKSPDFAGNLKRLIIMGGAKYTGNMSPVAEYNFWADPMAAHEVLMSGIQDVTMIGLDVTNKIALDGSMREILRMLNTKLSTFVYNITQEGMDENWRSRRKAVSPMHDVLTVAYFLDNSIVKLKPAYIDVVTEGIARGQSIVDIGGHWNENKCNAKYAYDVDVVKFYKLFYKEIFNEDITDLVEGK